LPAVFAIFMKDCFAVSSELASIQKIPQKLGMLIACT
jgi:hypothetical protein